MLFLGAQYYTEIANGDLQKVLKWTTDVDLFKKKFIIVPINDSLHWSLLVVVNPGNFSADSNFIAAPTSRRQNVACLLHLDSLGEKNFHDTGKIAKNISKWLQAEKNKHKSNHDSCPLLDIPCYKPAGG